MQDTNDLYDSILENQTDELIMQHEALETSPAAPVPDNELDVRVLCSLTWSVTFLFLTLNLPGVINRHMYIYIYIYIHINMCLYKIIDIQMYICNWFYI